MGRVFTRGSTQVDIYPLEDYNGVTGFTYFNIFSKTVQRWFPTNHV